MDFGISTISLYIVFLSVWSIQTVDFVGIALLACSITKRRRQWRIKRQSMWKNYVRSNFWYIRGTVFYYVVHYVSNKYFLCDFLASNNQHDRFSTNNLSSFYAFYPIVLSPSILLMTFQPSDIGPSTSQDKRSPTNFKPHFLGSTLFIIQAWQCSYKKCQMN